MAKRIPLRMCVVCRTMKPKAELVRVAKSPEGSVCADPCGRLPGRGAYLCREGGCLDKAQKVRAIERAFRGPVPAAVYQQLSIMKEVQGNG